MSLPFLRNDTMSKNFDVIIIGAGASGMACAAAATKRGLKTVVLEHNKSALRKVAVSGGGKCNFTNLKADCSHYVSNNPKFVISALKQFSPQDFLDLIRKHKIEFYEKTAEQLFCCSSSQEIINLLQKEAQKANIVYNIDIKDIRKENDLFKVQTNQDEYAAPSLVIACGGMSYPNLGASDIGYKTAKQFGLKVIPFKPALVPFNLDSELMKELIKLKGVALNARVQCGKFSITENILFTHFGLSGPAILQSSLYWNKGDKLIINLLPEVNIFDELMKAKNNSVKKKIGNILCTYLPEKVADYIVSENDLFISEVSNKQIQKIADHVNRWSVTPVGTQGFKLAEVTAGGVDTDEISSQTLEAKKVKGLFFIGEVLDVTGQLGGYNLQWAWSSGFTAGKNV